MKINDIQSSNNITIMQYKLIVQTFKEREKKYNPMLVHLNNLKKKKVLQIIAQG